MDRSSGCAYNIAFAISIPTGVAVFFLGCVMLYGSFTSFTSVLTDSDLLTALRYMASEQGVFATFGGVWFTALPVYVLVRNLRGLRRR